MRTAFEQLCDQLGVAQGTREAIVISLMVDSMIFADADYTDEEIVKSVAAQFVRWRDMGGYPELNQGYEIIAAETYATADTGKRYRVVLGHMKTQHGSMYVTWDSTSGGNAFADYFWGHYFDNEKAARADYHKRLAEHYAG